MEIKKILKYAIWAYIISFCVYQSLLFFIYKLDNIYFVSLMIPMIPIIIALLMNKPEVSLISIVLFIGMTILYGIDLFRLIKNSDYVLFIDEIFEVIYRLSLHIMLCLCTFICYDKNVLNIKRTLKTNNNINIKIDKLQKINTLLEKGIITKEEFEMKKREILEE